MFKWGMRTLNIIECCTENGNPTPVWEVRAQSVVTTFFSSSFFSVGKRPESRPESIEEEVLILLQNGPLSKSEISNDLGHTHISGRLKKVLVSLLGQGKITHTMPDKPNSRLQRYRLNQ
jgi:ATP-dependent DNA helicase RecG